MGLDITGLLLVLVGVLGVGGGRFWGTKSVENKYLPRVEHNLGCNNVQLKTAAAIREMKDEILEAIENNGNCSCNSED